MATNMPNKYYTIQFRNFQLNQVGFETLGDLDMTCNHHKLGMVLKSVPDMIHADVLTLLDLLTRLYHLQNQTWQTAKHFELDLTFHAIGAYEAKNIVSLSINFPGSSKAA